MENDNRPKLYIKNEEWWAPPQYIPDEIYDRIFGNGSSMMGLAPENYMPTPPPTWHFGPNSCRMLIPTTV
jgi:hypothetical protein